MLLKHVHMILNYYGDTINLLLQYKLWKVVAEFI